MRKALSVLLKGLSLILALFAVFSAVIVTTDLVCIGFEEEEDGE